MFEEMVVSSQTNKKTNKPMTVLISTVIQLSLVGILILIPLIYTEALPKAMLSTMLVAPPPPPPPPPPPVAQVVKVKPQVHLMQNNQLVAPKVIPKELKQIKEEAEPDPNMMGMSGGVPGGVAGGSMGGVLGGVIGGAVAGLRLRSRLRAVLSRAARLRPLRLSIVCSRSILRLRVRPAFPERFACTQSFPKMARSNSSKSFRAIHCWYKPRWTPCANGAIVRRCSMVSLSKWTPPLT